MYINSFCSISSAGTLTPSSSLSALQPLPERRAACIEPSYKDLIPPMQLRRMSKPVRTGVAAAKLCMQSLHDFMPQSIHVGTAYGMLDDSESFLKKMIEQEEQLLNPTAFIQSTHNTVSGQIALSIGCMAHNMTYVHHAHSFESALLDASLFIDNIAGDENILLGAVEELTDTSYNVLKRFDVYNEENIAGEGATFFAISKNKQTESFAKIEAFEIFKASSEAQANEAIETFKNKHSIGENAWCINSYNAINTASSKVMNYADHSGKYATMAAFGLAYSCIALNASDKQYAVITNKFGAYYSIILISKV